LSLLPDLDLDLFLNLLLGTFLFFKPDISYCWLQHVDESGTNKHGTELSVSDTVGLGYHGVLAHEQVHTRDHQDSLMRMKLLILDSTGGIWAFR
jgi:hypothetical protein